jgi:hypothetical protein
MVLPPDGLSLCFRYRTTVVRELLNPGSGLFLTLLPAIPFLKIHNFLACGISRSYVVNTGSNFNKLHEIIDMLFIIYSEDYSSILWQGQDLDGVIPPISYDDFFTGSTHLLLTLSHRKHTLQNCCAG